MQRAITTYGLAIGGLTAAVIARTLLDPWLGDALPFVTLFGAVAYAAWIGGPRPAVLVTLLGYVAADFLFIAPRGRLDSTDFPQAVGFVAYVFTCGLIVALGETARRAMARATERRELMRVTLASIGDAVITTDVDGRITYLNDVAEAITGWRQQEAAGRDLGVVFHIVNEHSRQPVESPATRALRDGVVVGLANHTVLIRKDGSECPIDDSAAPIRDEAGRVSGCVLIFRDVTLQRRIERERAEQLHTTSLLAAIVESSDDAIISKSLKGIIQSWNVAAERLFGYTAEQAIGKHISLIIPPERLQEEEQIIARLSAGERIDHFETERLRHGGGRIHLSLTISPIRDASGSVVGASKIAHDITERKQAETERETFAQLMENSTDFIGMFDLAGIPYFVNRAGRELVGLDSVEQARTTPLAEFFFPEDQQRIVDQFLPEVLANGHGELDVRFRHFKTGEPRWMAYKVITLPGADGKPTGFATVSQDVTQRKKLADDLRGLAADLSDADRRKNEFLAMLAHELRNPLAPISNAARTLRRGIDDAEAVRAAAEMLERQVAQLSRLVDDLLDVSRITRGKIGLQRAQTALTPIVEQALEAVRPQVQRMNHRLRVNLPPHEVYLDGDSARLAQVLGNLLNNACKFTDPGGQIVVNVTAEKGHVVIRVRDNGIGIAPADLPIVFDMFSQVDASIARSRDGLGIGLTLVKTLVELHGGSVMASSDGPGRGSEFTIRLPTVEARDPAASQPSATATARVTPHRVLIVDDNKDGAETLSMLLDFEGHETRMAHTGQDGLEEVRRFRPSVMLLDIGLPGMSGYDVCRRVREEWGKTITIVALTGWGQDEHRKQAREAGFDTHMVKPVNHDALMKLLASIPRAGDVSSSAS